MNKLIMRGDLLRDNNPKKTGRELRVVEVLPRGVLAKDCWGVARFYLMKSIHTDGKPRKSGFNLITTEAEILALLIAARALLCGNSEPHANQIWLARADAVIARETGSNPQDRL